MPISREYLEKNKNRHNRIAADGVTVIPATEGSRAIPTEYIGYLPTSAPKEVTREDLDGPADGVSPQQSDILYHLTDEQLGIMTLDQVDAWVEAHPFIWIVDNLLRKSTFNVIAADPKQGKTRLVDTLALCVAGSGTDHFVGRKVLLNGPVVYYNLETQPNNFNALVKSYDRPPHNLLMISSFPKDFEQTGIPAVEHVRHILARKKPLMVLIDMYWNIDGVEDENAYGQVYKSLWTLKAMVEKQFTDSCMVVTLHTRKPPNRPHGGRHNDDFSTRDTADILGSTAFRGVPHSMIMLNKNPNTEIRYINSQARDGVNLPTTPLRMLESGLIVSDDRLIQPHHDEMDVTESRKAQFIMAVHRYCVDHQKPAVSFDCVCSWSGLHRSQYTPACKIAIDDGYIVCSGGKDNKGLVGVSRHPILYSIAPNVHLPAAWYALQLPKDAFATQDTFATQKEGD